MNSTASTAPARFFVPFALLAAASALSAVLIAGSDAVSSAMVALGLAVALACFLWTELSIHLLIAAMLLSPEFSIGSTSGATLSRGITLRLDDFLILLIAATWFLKSALYRHHLVVRTPLNAAMALYSSACVLSTMLGIAAGRVQLATGSLFILKYIEYFVVYFMVVNIAREEAQVRRFLAVLIAVLAVVSVIGIMQIPTGLRVSAPFEGPDGEPNTFGGYLLLMMAVLAGVILTTTARRWPLVIVLALSATAFVYTLSRASYLGLIPVALLLPLLVRRAQLLIGVALAFLFVLYSPSILPRAAVERIEFTYSQPFQKKQMMLLGRRVDTSTSARLEMFGNATDAFIEQPVFGWGVTGWGFVDSQYFRILVDTGLVGMTAFLFLIFRLLQTAWRTRLKMAEVDPAYFGLASGFIAGTFAMLVHSIGSNTFIIVRIMEPFWLLAGVVTVLPSVFGLEPRPGEALDT